MKFCPSKNLQWTVLYKPYDIYTGKVMFSGVENIAALVLLGLQRGSAVGIKQLI